jgi:hypothetical protein
LRIFVIYNLIEKNRATWYSNFSWRPGKLFDQVNRALTIFNTVKGNKQVAFSSSYQKWNADHREYLFPTMSFTEFSEKRSSFWFPKTSASSEKSILGKVLSSEDSIPRHLGQSNNRVYYRTTGGLYWKVFTDFAPKFFLNGVAGSSSRETSISVVGDNTNSKIVGLLSSNLFWWWYTLTANLRDLNPSDINGFQFPKSLLKSSELLKVSDAFLDDLKHNSVMLQREQKGKGFDRDSII